MCIRDRCVGVAFYLHSNWFYSHLRIEVIEQLVVEIEIADADGADFALGNGFLQFPPTAHVVAHRLVQIDKVDVVGAQTGEHLVDGRQSFPPTILVWPKFGSNPYLLAGTPLSLIACPMLRSLP